VVSRFVLVAHHLPVLPLLLRCHTSVTPVLGLAYLLLLLPVRRAFHPPPACFLLRAPPACFYITHRATPLAAGRGCRTTPPPRPYRCASATTSHTTTLPFAAKKARHRLIFPHMTHYVTHKPYPDSGSSLLPLMHLARISPRYEHVASPVTARHTARAAAPAHACPHGCCTHTHARYANLSSCLS